MTNQPEYERVREIVDFSAFKCPECGVMKANIPLHIKRHHPNYGKATFDNAKYISLERHQSQLEKALTEFSDLYSNKLLELYMTTTAFTIDGKLAAGHFKVDEVMKLKDQLLTKTLTSLHGEEESN